MSASRGARAAATTAGLAVALCACAGSAADVPVADAARSEDSFVLAGVSNMTQVAQLTGPGAINDTESVAVAGTDLGSMVNVGERTYFVFGDTFGTRDPDSTGGQGGNWRSNALAHTTDTDPADGITFDGWVVDDIGLALEPVPGAKDPNDGTGEVTRIPTYGFVAGDGIYLHYMSVSLWGTPGRWDANHAGLARSVDDGQTWEVLDAPQWPGDSGFVQVAAAQVHEDGEDFVYLWSIPAGRFGSVRLMKVPAEPSAVEDADAYRYFAGTDDGGQPVWSENLDDAVTVVDGNVGELSVMYSEYLDRWLMASLLDDDAVVREGLTPWGPWGEPVTITTQEETPGLYAPYLNPRYVSDDGRTVYFSMSLWDPYNVFWYSLDLERA